MKPPSPLQVFKLFRGPKIEFHVGLPRKWCIKIAYWYMWSRFYREYIRMSNIKHAWPKGDWK